VTRDLRPVTDFSRSLEIQRCFFTFTLSQNSPPMNKKALWLLLIGSLLMALPIWSFLEIPVDAGDFIKGVGFTFIVASLVKSRNVLVKK
jgi:hypothetical protein